MVDGYGENDPIVVKSQFIMSLVERIDPKGVGAKQKSIIDRCTGKLYEDAERSGMVPTLATLREKLLDQPEEMAHDIALALELFTTGSLDIFGHKSTVDLDKRVREVYEQFRRLCQDQGKTPYSVLQGLLTAWIEQTAEEDKPHNLITLCWRCHAVVHGTRLPEYPDWIDAAEIEQACVEYVADMYAPDWWPWSQSCREAREDGG